MNAHDDVENYLPLTEVSYMILLSLASSPQHGYAIMKDVEELSHGRIQLSTGTLYGAIKRLLEDSWIQRNGAPQPGLAGKPRQSYQLTTLGQRVLAAEVQRLESLLAASKRIHTKPKTSHSQPPV